MTCGFQTAQKQIPFTLCLYNNWIMATIKLFSFFSQSMQRMGIDDAASTEYMCLMFNVKLSKSIQLFLSICCFFFIPFSITQNKSRTKIIKKKKKSIHADHDFVTIEFSIDFKWLSLYSIVSIWNFHYWNIFHLLHWWVGSNRSWQKEKKNWRRKWLELQRKKSAFNCVNLGCGSMLKRKMSSKSPKWNTI